MKDQPRDKDGKWTVGQARVEGEPDHDNIVGLEIHL